MKLPSNPKERNLIKGAIRRVFSRSELRLQALSLNDIQHTDPLRPRVTKWTWCSDCGVIFPRYLAQVDHVSPVVRTNERFEDLSWTEFIEERIWCSIENLRVLCEDCHNVKTTAENKERKRIKNENR